MKSDKSPGILRVWQMGMAWLLLVGAVTVAVCRDAIAKQAEVKADSDSPRTHAEELFSGGAAVITCKVFWVPRGR